ECLGEGASISAGIAVVHYKEDLRFALERARAAEKAAKQIGKKHGDSNTKDALALTVCRRSGEHTTVVLGWQQAPLVTELVNDFGSTVKKASDRWAYKLRAELPTLSALPLPAGRAETLRLVARVEQAPGGFDDRVLTLFDAHQKEMQRAARNWPD